MTDTVSFCIKQNPTFLRVNLRFKNRQALPAPVREAIKRVTDEACEACKSAEWKTGKAYVGIDVTFAVNTRKQDFDGPEKRVVDAIAAGCGFDDSRIQKGCFTRTIVPEGQEHIEVTLYQIPADEGETLPARWKGNDPVLVWESEGGSLG